LGGPVRHGDHPGLLKPAEPARGARRITPAC
jgi:hypothetical protein